MGTYIECPGSRVRPSVRPSLRPRTSRDIHVIYADSNSADFAAFSWSQCKHSKKGTVRRDWNDVDNRNGRDVLEKRQRRETEGAVFETRGTGKEGINCIIRTKRVTTSGSYIHSATVLCDKYILAPNRV